MSEKSRIFAAWNKNQSLNQKTLQRIIDATRIKVHITPDIPEKQ